MEKYLQHLAEVPLFRTLDESELTRVARLTDEVNVEAGRVLTTEGSLGREAFIIVSGEAVVTKGGIELATLTPGDCFGELALLDGGERTATVTATTPLDVLVLEQRGFSSLLEDVPSLAVKLLRTVAGRIRMLEENHLA